MIFFVFSETHPFSLSLLIKKIKNDKALSLYSQRLGLDQDILKKSIAYNLSLQKRTNDQEKPKSNTVASTYLFDDAKSYKYIDLSKLLFKN